MHVRFRFFGLATLDFTKLFGLKMNFFVGKPPEGKSWVMTGTDACGDLQCHMPFRSCAMSDASSASPPVLSCEESKPSFQVYETLFLDLVF